MTRKKYRLVTVLLQLIAQVVGGVVLFAMAPQAIFADIGSDALAQPWVTPGRMQPSLYMDLRLYMECCL